MLRHNKEQIDQGYSRCEMEYFRDGLKRKGGT